MGLDGDGQAGLLGLSVQSFRVCQEHSWGLRQRPSCSFGSSLYAMVSCESHKDHSVLQGLGRVVESFGVIFVLGRNLKYSL